MVGYEVSQALSLHAILPVLDGTCERPTRENAQDSTQITLPVIIRVMTGPLNLNVAGRVQEPVPVQYRQKIWEFNFQTTEWRGK